MELRPSPPASSAGVRARMRALARRDTRPELLLRRQLHAMGLRYRVDHPLPTNRRRRGDIVFTARRVVVFVDGCFWHQCPEHYSEPRSNAAWWREKISRNVARDRDTDASLEAAGWRVVRVWEHEPVEEMVARVSTALER